MLELKASTRQQQSAFMSSCQSFLKCRRHFFSLSSPPFPSLQTGCISFGREPLRSLFSRRQFVSFLQFRFFSSSPFSFSLQLFLSLSFLRRLIPSRPPLGVETHFNDTPTPGPVSPSPCQSAHAALLPSVSSPLQQPTSSTLCALKKQLFSSKFLFKRTD